MDCNSLKLQHLELLKLQASINGHNARRILLLAGNPLQCMICNSIIRVQAHHKDKDRRNNNLTNLEFRCQSCHHYVHRSTYDVFGKPPLKEHKYLHPRKFEEYHAPRL